MPRATGSAAAIKQALGLEAILIKGGRGIFEVKVDGTTVAKKTLDGFPTPEEIVAAVRQATP
ncbi:MAG: Rdx family protein [Proteobacteria bacterium]|nr:Rdx family protein [Pseudomonadota bacterium]